MEFSTHRSFSNAHQILEIIFNHDNQIKLNNPPTLKICKKKVYKHIQELKEQDIFDVTHFQEKISSIIKCNSTKINREPKLWWSEALTKCYQEKCEARKIYNRNATRTNLIALNRSEAVFKKTKKKKKKTILFD